jgi:hypothetical protein
MSVSRKEETMRKKRLIGVLAGVALVAAMATPAAALSDGPKPVTVTLTVPETLTLTFTSPTTVAYGEKLPGTTEDKLDVLAYTTVRTGPSAAKIILSATGNAPNGMFNFAKGETDNFASGNYLANSGSDSDPWRTISMGTLNFTDSIRATVGAAQAPISVTQTVNYLLTNE